MIINYEYHINYKQNENSTNDVVYYGGRNSKKVRKFLVNKDWSDLMLI